MTTVDDITNKIEKFAPPYLAEDWDPIGLSFGSKNKKVNRVLVALDLDANTLKEAKEKEIDLIFTHHPAIFSSLKTLNEEDARRREYLELIRADIALYSAHTNIDAAEKGMNYWLAETLELKDPLEVLDTTYQSTYKLLVLYTPQAEAALMREKLHAAGAGQVGDYSNVSYTSKGEGHFTPSSDADPTIGSENQAEVVGEERTEILFPKHLLPKILHTIYTEHPYEEPVFHLMDIGKKVKEYGIGRVGDLKKTQTFGEMISFVKDAFGVPHLRYANASLETPVHRVAVLGGSGDKYYKQAIAKQADLYITGDISYHGAQDMLREGLLFIDVGHFVEHIFVEKMTAYLKKWAQEEKWEIEVIPATSQEDVFKFSL